MPARTDERSRPRPIRQEITTQQAVASYRKTNSTRKSAAELGITRKRLAEHLDKAGVVRRVRLDPKKVAASYKRTGSCNITAAEFGVSNNTICGILDRLGIPRTGATKRISTEQIVASYNRTQSSPKTAAEFGISTRTVRYHLEKAGVSRQDRRVTLDEQALVAAYERDKSIVKVAAIFAVDPSTVAARLAQAGVERNGNKVAVDPLALASQFERNDKSLTATAKAFGISHKTVGEILDRNGFTRPRQQPFTQEQIAASYARTNHCARSAEEIGIHPETVRLHLAEMGIQRRTYFPATHLFSTEQLRELLHELATKKLSISRFAEINGLSRPGLMRTMRERIPAEYDAVVTQNRGWSKTGEELKKGWNFEHLCCNALRRAEFHVYHSPRSLGPADIIAISTTGQSYAIQAKVGGALPPKEWNALVDHAKLMNAIPVLAAYKGNEIAFWRLLDHKGGEGRSQPYEPIDLLGETVTETLLAQLAA
jgi:hypothetical protein